MIRWASVEDGIRLTDTWIWQLVVFFDDPLTLKTWQRVRMLMFLHGYCASWCNMLIVYIWDVLNKIRHGVPVFIITSGELLYLSLGLGSTIKTTRAPDRMVENAVLLRRTRIWSCFHGQGVSAASTWLQGRHTTSKEAKHDVGDRM